MTTTTEVLFRHPDSLFIDGEWVSPAGGTSIAVVDSTTEEVFLRVGEANTADMDRAVGAARRPSGRPLSPGALDPAWPGR